MKAKLINESLIKKDKKDEIMNYKSIISDAWGPLISEAKDRYSINFDLENNECVDKRIFRKKSNLRIGQEVTSVIPIEMWEAAGDWEYPVIYFKVNIESDHYLIKGQRSQSEKKYPWDFERNEKFKSQLSHHHFVIIPPISAGNKYTECVNCKKYKYSAWTDDSIGFDSKNASITDKDKSKAWKWLENYLDSAIAERYKRLDLDQNPLGSDPLDVIPEGVTPADPKNARSFDDLRKGNLKSPGITNSTSLSEELSASAALYGFAGWLTSRDQKTIMSAKNDAGIVAKLVADFIDKQKLKQPKGRWERDLIPMNESKNKSIKGYREVIKAVKSSRKLSKEMKANILPKIKPTSRYNNGKVLNLKGGPGKGCSLGADENGWFVFTHRARSESKDNIDKIPQKDIKFIESTG